jgi:type III pantothenate kinase
MLLAIDIGNSSVAMGIFSATVLAGKLSIPTWSTGDAGLYRGAIDAFLSQEKAEKRLGGVIISSVVPELTAAVVDSIRGFSSREPLVVTSSMDTGLVFDVQRPAEIGTDRIANVVAAMHAFGGPVAVIDFGTATTVSVVRDRRFLGGAILPGIRLMGEALHRGTARLPAIDFSEKTTGLAASAAALGKSTTASMISGMIYGTAGAVDRIIRGIETEEGCRFGALATGGFASVVMPYMERECSLDPDLTLKGLRMIYERNA